MIERIEFNDAGFKALLGDDSVKDMIEGYTSDIKQRADAYIVGESEGFNGSMRFNGTRWVGLVGTSDYATLIAESEQKALSKAVNG